MKHIVKTGKALALAIAITAIGSFSLPSSSQAGEIEDLRDQFGKQYERGQFKEIFATLGKMEALVKAKHGEGSERHVKVLDRLANQFKVIGRKKNAEGVLLKAIALAEGKLGKDSKSVLQSRSSLGILYVGQNRIDEAKKQFELASAIAEKVYGPDDMETKIMKNNLKLLSK
ncbi:MAG: tetratricopeptide repeat protein [Methyloligellaceae bacterium]